MLTTLPQPVIARVNGVAAGAGANIALACDIVVAAKSAKFIQSFSALGLIPDSGGSWVLPRLVGQARALGLALTGEPLSAEKAEDWGLIWKAVDDDALDAEVDAIAGKLASLPPLGLAAIKDDDPLRPASAPRPGTGPPARRDATARLHRRLPRGRCGVPREADPKLYWTISAMKTVQLLNYERDRWVAGDGNLAEISSAIDGAPVALTGSGGARLRRHAPPRPRGRRTGAAAADLPRAGADAQGARPGHHGAQGRAVRAQLPHRRDPQGWLDRYRGRRRHALLLLVQGPPRAARRARAARRPARGLVEAAARSSASTSTPRCRAPRCTSTLSISRCGECWRSSRRPCLPACPRS